MGIKKRSLNHNLIFEIRMHKITNLKSRKPNRKIKTVLDRMWMQRICWWLDVFEIDWPFKETLFLYFLFLFLSKRKLKTKSINNESTDAPTPHSCVFFPFQATSNLSFCRQTAFRHWTNFSIFFSLSFEICGLSSHRLLLKEPFCAVIFVLNQLFNYSETRL